MNNSLVTIVRRTTLVLAALMCLSMSLLVTAPAFAATIPESTHAVQQTKPLVSGGGCYSWDYISSCISENSGYIEPDAYADGSMLCNVDVRLYSEGYFVNNVWYSGCYTSGTPFDGPQGYQAYYGLHWYTITCADVSALNGRFCIESFTQVS